MWDILIPIAIVGGVVAAIAIAVSVAERKRRRALVEVAQQMQLQFHPDAVKTMDASLEKIELFTLGRGRTSSNRMTGRIADLEVMLFDYSYTTGSGKSTATHRQTVVAFRAPAADIPAFRVRREGLFDRIGQAMGMQDIDFAENVEFSRRFLVKAANESAVRAIFSDGLMNLLMRNDRLCFAGAGEWLCIYRAGKRMKPQDYAKFLEESFEIATAALDGASRALE